MINLNILKENQKVKAIFKPDIAFNSLQMFVYDKSNNMFIMEDRKDFTYSAEVVLTDPDWQVFLISYNEKFNASDWDWNAPKERELETDVKYFDKNRGEFI